MLEWHSDTKLRGSELARDDAILTTTNTRTRHLMMKWFKTLTRTDAIATLALVVSITSAYFSYEQYPAPSIRTCKSTAGWPGRPIRSFN